MSTKDIIRGFSKLNKEEKIDRVAFYFKNPNEIVSLLKRFWHEDPNTQSLFDEFSENTISNYYFPYGVAPNFVINGEKLNIPMVIEESSVVAAAASSAKFWSDFGGFHAKVISTVKIGQVHFIWHGQIEKLRSAFSDLKLQLFKDSSDITQNMRNRGGGIQDIELIDMSHEIDGYYQLKVSFNTVDSMGANFINSCLEEFAQSLLRFFAEDKRFEGEDAQCQIIMSILSNYTPDCIVEAWVETDIQNLENVSPELSAEEFVWKFDTAVKIAQIDVHRATTHNKGIFNGIDAVVLATGNDFRAVEAGAHAYAAEDGKYKSLTSLELKDGKFKYKLRIPLALGTVGGLTSLHPLAKLSMSMMENPNAEELMMITAVVGLANNYSAVKSLVTSGIQKGHMKMHLNNILNSLDATIDEKAKTNTYFAERKVSMSAVREFLNDLRNKR